MRAPLRRRPLAASVAAALLAGALATGAASAAPVPHASIPMALPALRTVSYSLAAGLKLKRATTAVLKQLAQNAYAWIPQSSCLATAIDSADGTPCTIGDTTASTTVVLFGDSSADEWALDLGALGLAHHFRVVAYLHAACPVGDVTVELAGGSVDPTCAAFRSNVLSELAQMRPAPALVLVSELRLSNFLTGSGQPLTNSAWSAALTTTLDQIEGDGLAVASLHGVDVEATSPAPCISANATHLSACTTRVAAADPGGYDAATKRGASTADAGDVDLRPLLCTSVACPAVVDAEVTHAGDNHVAEAYSAKVTAALGELLACLASEDFDHSTKAAVVVDDLLGKQPSRGFLRACKGLPS